MQVMILYILFLNDQMMPSAYILVSVMKVWISGMRGLENAQPNGISMNIGWTPLILIPKTITSWLLVPQMELPAYGIWEVLV